MCTKEYLLLIQNLNSNQGTQESPYKINYYINIFQNDWRVLKI